MTDDNSKPDVHATTDAGDGIERGELVGPHEQDSAEVLNETVTAPAKVMRIGSMVKQLLEEVRSSEFDEASRETFFYRAFARELGRALGLPHVENPRSGRRHLAEHYQFWGRYPF